MKQALALAAGAAVIIGTMMYGEPGLSAAGKVTLCHRTGNGGGHIIEIAESALKAHMAHGDNLEAAGLKSGTPCQIAAPPPVLAAVPPPPPPPVPPPPTVPVPVPPPAPVPPPPPDPILK